MYTLAWYTGLQQGKEELELSGEVTQEYNVIQMPLGMLEENDDVRDFYIWYADKEDVPAEDGIALDKTGYEWTLKLPADLLPAGEYPIYVKAEDEEGHIGKLKDRYRMQSWILPRWKCLITTNMILKECFRTREVRENGHTSETRIRYCKHKHIEEQKAWLS